MVFADYEFFRVVLSIHVIAAIAAFGVTFFYPVMQIFAEKTEGGRHLPFTLRLTESIDSKVNLLGLLPGITGAYQIWKAPSNWNLFDDHWLLGGVILYVVMYGIVLLILSPTLKTMIAEATRAQEAAAPDGALELGPDYRAASRKAALSGTATGLVVLTIVFLMVYKPGA